MHTSTEKRVVQILFYYYNDNDAYELTKGQKMRLNV